MRKHLIISPFVFVLITLVFLACSKDDEIPFKAPIKYLALGDSYTIGQAVEESLRWPNQLSKKLEENEFEISETKIIATTGWKTADLLIAIEDSTSLDEYNLVSLLIGVNNQFWGQPFEIFTSEFDSLVTKSIEFAGKERVFVVSIPDYGVTPFGSSNSEYIGQQIDMYNDYIEQHCMDRDIPFVNITEISRQLGDSPGALSPDNLHPSGTQYAMWVDEMLPTVLEILAE